MNITFSYPLYPAKKLPSIHSQNSSALTGLGNESSASRIERHQPYFGAKPNKDDYKAFKKAVQKTNPNQINQGLTSHFQNKSAPLRQCLHHALITGEFPGGLANAINILSRPELGPTLNLLRQYNPNALHDPTSLLHTALQLNNPQSRWNFAQFLHNNSLYNPNDGHAFSELVNKNEENILQLVLNHPQIQSNTIQTGLDFAQNHSFTALTARQGGISQNIQRMLQRRLSEVVQRERQNQNPQQNERRGRNTTVTPIIYQSNDLIDSRARGSSVEHLLHGLDINSPGLNASPTSMRQGRSHSRSRSPLQALKEAVNRSPASHDLSRLFNDLSRGRLSQANKPALELFFNMWDGPTRLIAPGPNQEEWNVFARKILNSTRSTNFATPAESPNPRGLPSMSSDSTLPPNPNLYKLAADYEKHKSNLFYTNTCGYTAEEVSLLKKITDNEPAARGSLTAEQTVMRELFKAKHTLANLSPPRRRSPSPIRNVVQNLQNLTLSRVRSLSPNSFGRQVSNLRTNAELSGILNKLYQSGRTEKVRPSSQEVEQFKTFFRNKSTADSITNTEWHSLAHKLWFSVTRKSDFVKTSTFRNPGDIQVTDGLEPNTDLLRLAFAFRQGISPEDREDLALVRDRLREQGVPESIVKNVKKGDLAVLREMTSDPSHDRNTQIPLTFEAQVIKLFFRTKEQIDELYQPPSSSQLQQSQAPMDRNRNEKLKIAAIYRNLPRNERGDFARLREEVSKQMGVSIGQTLKKADMGWIRELSNTTPTPKQSPVLSALLQQQNLPMISLTHYQGNLQPQIKEDLKLFGLYPPDSVPITYYADTIRPIWENIQRNATPEMKTAYTKLRDLFKETESNATPVPAQHVLPTHNIQRQVRTTTGKAQVTQRIDTLFNPDESIIPSQSSHRPSIAHQQHLSQINISTNPQIRQDLESLGISTLNLPTHLPRSYYENTIIPAWSDLVDTPGFQPIQIEHMNECFQRLGRVFETENNQSTPQRTINPSTSTNLSSSVSASSSRSQQSTTVASRQLSRDINAFNENLSELKKKLQDKNLTLDSVSIDARLKVATYQFDGPEDMPLEDMLLNLPLTVPMDSSQLRTGRQILNWLQSQNLIPDYMTKDKSVSIGRFFKKRNKSAYEYFTTDRGNSDIVGYRLKTGWTDS